MTKLGRLGLCAIAAAWIGCGTTTDGTDGPEGPGGPGGPGDGEDPPVEGRLVLSLHLSDGAAMPGDVFAAGDQVHLRTHLDGALGTYADGDLAFVVVDAAGARVSTDPQRCRRIRVSYGRIVEVLAAHTIEGLSCAHSWTMHDDGDLLVQLSPYATGTAPRKLSVQVARVDELIGDAFPATALRAAFTIGAP